MLLGHVAHRKGCFADGCFADELHAPAAYAADGEERDGGAGRNCTAVRERLSPDSTCVSASEISLTTSRSGQNRRQPAPENLATIGRGTPIATSPRKWHPFPARGPAGTDVEA